MTAPTIPTLDVEALRSAADAHAALAAVIADDIEWIDVNPHRADDLPRPRGGPRDARRPARQRDRHEDPRRVRRRPARRPDRDVRAARRNALHERAADRARG